MRISLILKEAGQIGIRSAENGLIFLNEHVGAWQRTEKAKAVHIFCKGSVISIHTDKFDIVTRREPHQLIVAADLLQVSCVIETEMVYVPRKLGICSVNPPKDVSLFLVEQANIKGLGKIDLYFA